MYKSEILGLARREVVTVSLNSSQRNCLSSVEKKGYYLKEHIGTLKLYLEPVALSRQQYSVGQLQAD